MSDGPTFARFVPEPGNNNNNNGNNNDANDNDDDNSDGINFDGWVTEGVGGTNNNTNNFSNAQVQAWREQERRQRTVRSFMMFLVMLMLMDGEEQTQQKQQQRNKQVGGLRGASGNNNNPTNNRHMDNINSVESDMELHRARRIQDRSIESIVLHGNHSRAYRLVEKNKGRDVDREMRAWAEKERTLQTMVIYEQLLKDLVLEQPDGSFMKVLVASKENKDDVTVVDDPSKVLRDAAALTGKRTNKESQEHYQEDLEDAVKDFEKFQDEEKEIWHYPWNATGYYRGEWTLLDTVESSPSSSLPKASLRGSSVHESEQDNVATQELTPVEAEAPLLEYLQKQADPSIGLHMLPVGTKVKMPFNNEDIWEKNNRDVAFTLLGAPKNEEKTTRTPQLPKKLPLTKTSGKIAFQLYSKKVPAMKELSLIDGYMKIYDSNTIAYSTRRDILLRVRGVLVHSLGRLTLVANPESLKNMALLINDYPAPTPGSTSQSNEKVGLFDTESDPTQTPVGVHDDGEDDESKNQDTLESQRRRLQELLSPTNNTPEDERIETIRNHALQHFVQNIQDPIDLSSYKRILGLSDDPTVSEHGFHEEYMSSLTLLEEQDAVINALADPKRRRLDETDEEDKTDEEKNSNALVEIEEDADGGTPIATRRKIKRHATTGDTPAYLIYSKHVVPFPFAWDDEKNALQISRAPISSRLLTQRETSLEINAGMCEFEINMDVQEEKWTVGQWKKLIKRYMEQDILGSALGPRMKGISPTSTSYGEKYDNEDEERKRVFTEGTRPVPNGGSKTRKRNAMEQDWIMTFNGTLVSPNCGFKANVNATAIRTDWESTTGKAINYSFYMMGVCLIQIVLLLRQLLHSQAQSAAIKVSILCIGWQTVIDALLCLFHIYLSLAMQPLFTAFASVAFFKLLIFCVIEMKYMTIIIQARNASNGGGSLELLRRQVAMLHLRFYAALMGTCLGFFYADNYRTLYLLLLYSFWVPQIVHNVITEGKKPMNSYYIYGMSITRLMPPLYMFAFQGNFLKEIYPESPTNMVMSQLLVSWVVLQAFILDAQSRWGARFFIPRQFLPPKYDYHRPIPESLMPPSEEIIGNPSEQLQKERETPKTEVRPIVQKGELSPRVGARNRKEGKHTKGGKGMIVETVTEVPKRNNAPCIDCVICYNGIDASDRSAYMIAPCNHIFHKDCLAQWMEVKMECPICRNTLPPP